MLRLEDKYYITSTTDINGIITDASNAFCEISGYSKEELIGKPHNIVRHPDMGNEVFKELWKTISKGDIWFGKIKNKTKNGKAYWVDATIEPLFDEERNILGYKAIRFDITDRKKLKKKYKQKRRLLDEFKLVIQTVNSGIAFLDVEHNFIVANPYILKLLEYTEDEILTKKCTELTAPEFKEENFQAYTIAKETLVAQKIIKQCLKKDGSRVWTETVYQFFDEKRMLVVIKNIDSYKELEEKNKIFLTQSKQAAMGEMIAMIAHQWRQPITTIATILSKMKIKYDLDILNKNDFNSDFTKTKSIINHLSKTIDTFQDYFKEKQGNKVSVTDLFERVSNIILPILKNYSISLVFNDSSIECLVDDRLDQVLLNIYQNSSDALKNNDSVEKKIILTSVLEDDNKQIVIRISDNGGGIREEIIEKIFTPYFSTKSKNGSGLGLYMSKEIVENHIGGTLKVRNTDTGACFEIIVPSLN